ncbi:BnaA09g01680D [Brassica napus]|uniref:BnaA09g01680D protein n=1 Tax=Brassica napus TaxID=3708 RepID=A0A078IF29_BRANA|nr:BnaA09g01680D [Brassica napus]
MAIELSRKAYELTEMEELISDLKAQNEKLLKKVQNCAVEHKKEDGDGRRRRRQRHASSGKKQRVV